MDSTKINEGLPDNIKKFLNPSAPKELKLKAAKGLFPLSINEQIILLSLLFLEPDEEIKRTAKISIQEIPYDSIKNVLNDLPSQVLDVLSIIFEKNTELLELIAMNKNTPTETLLRLIKIGTPSVLEVISLNQTRLMKEQKILDALLESPTLSASTQSRLQEFFLKQLSKIYLKPEEIAKIETKKKVEVEEKAEIERKEEVSEFEPTISEPGLSSPEEQTSEGPRQLDSIEIPQDIPQAFFEIPKELTLDTEKEEQPEERETILKKLTTMNVSDKIKLALFGNKEVRTTLIRDANKIVATTVLKSPKVTDGEIAMYANSRNVCDDVIRIIAGNKEWVKNYRVKVALVNNPKTPVPVAMKLVSSLNIKDLKDLAGSRNVSSAVSNLARNLLNQRKAG